MTSGGITKRTFCVWATVAFSLTAMLCGFEFMNGGDPIQKVMAIAAVAFMLISLGGVWANGLPKSTDPDE